MILDAQNLLSEDQALTATAVSTNVIDLGGDYNLGIGEPMSVVVALGVAADDTTGDETYVVTLETDDNSSFSSATVIGTKTITRGDAAGTKQVIGVPADTSCEQYIRLNYTLGGTTPTVTVTSWLTMTSMIQNDVAYASGFSIS